MTRRALITGGSAGIGEAFADVFADHGYDIVLVARRADRLRAVAERLDRQHRVHVDVIVADLSVPGASSRVCEEIATRGLTIDALVNNAGYGVPGPYTGSTWDQHAAFLNVMVVAVTEMTHRLLPGMVSRRFGRIVNVASLAGLVPAPGDNTLYAASKSFLIKFSEALAHEVAHQGVHVTAVCPGFTHSEFHDVAGTRETVSKLPSFMWMHAATVARQGFEAVEAGRPLIVNGRVNRMIAVLAGMLPRGLGSAIKRLRSWAYRDAGSG